MGERQLGSSSVWSEKHGQSPYAQSPDAQSPDGDEMGV